MRMKYLVLVFLISVPLDLLFAQKWEILNPYFSDGDSLVGNARITFTNKEIGWLFTVFQKESPNGDFYKKIYKTTDGGLSWVIKRFEHNRNFYIPTILSKEPDYFILIYQSDRDTISRTLLTFDGGETWESLIFSNRKIPSIDKISQIWLFNDTNGIAFNNYRWFTTDGGRHWEKRGDTITSFPIPSDVYFINESLGWMVSNQSYYATDSGYLAATTDGGKTWNYQDSITMIMYGVDFINQTKGFAVATNWNFSTGFIYSTMDSGNSWMSNQFVGSQVFWDIGFFDEEYGWITGSGKILRTTNGGETWETQIEGLNSNLKKIIILKEDKTAYVFGDDYNNKTHTILRADLNKLTDVKEIEMLPNEFVLSQNYPNPFNSQTVIEYVINQPTFVQLKVFNISGKEVRTLVQGYKTRGKYEIVWNGKNNIGGEVTSGVYIYQFNTNFKTERKKLIMLK